MADAELASVSGVAHFDALPPVPAVPPVDEPPFDEPPVPDVLPPVPPLPLAAPPLPPVSSPGSASSVVHAVVRPSKQSVVPPIQNLRKRVVVSIFVSVLKAAGNQRRL